MKVVDANVLLYAVDETSPQHTSSRDWLDGALAGTETVGFAWSVLLAFVRLSTHPAVFERPLEAKQSMVVVEGWVSRPPATILDPTRRHLGVLSGLLASTGTAANLVNDAHLAALAVEHGAGIVSFDADFGRFPGLAWEKPGESG